MDPLQKPIWSVLLFKDKDPILIQKKISWSKIRDQITSPIIGNSSQKPAQ